MSCNIRVCKGSARSSIFSRSEFIWQYWRNCCFGKGRGNTETPSKLANHNAQGQLTNHNTFRFSEGGASSNPELIELFLSGWGERCCNNVNYVKNNAIFESPSMRACSSTPPKQHQDFVKEHNRTPLIDTSAVKRLIASKIKVFVYRIYVYCVYLLCIYKYKHMHVYIYEKYVMFLY